MPTLSKHRLQNLLNKALMELKVSELLSSTSRGVSSVTIEFNLDRDLESAANDVRDRVSRAQRNLPRDVDPPIVEKPIPMPRQLLF